MANYEDLDAYIQDLEEEIRRKEQDLLENSKRYDERTRKDMIPSRFVQRKKYSLVLQLIRNYDLNPRAFWNSFRMSHRQFEMILNRTRNDLTLSAANSLKAEEQLGLFLLMVGQGYTFDHLSSVTNFGVSTIRLAVERVSTAIWNRMSHEFLRTPATEEEWRNVALEFVSNCYLPHCLGALDGKHVRITKPPNCGSEFFNYKKFNSFVLLALADSKSRFLWADIGSYGSHNDARIFNSSQLCIAMDSGTLRIPAVERLPLSNIRFPYFIVGDDIFALRSWLLKPFNGEYLTEAEKQYNYRLSVGRRVVEQAFGRLYQKFRIFGVAPSMNPERYVSIVKALLVVHNFLIDTSLDEENRMAEEVERGQDLEEFRGIDRNDLNDRYVDNQAARLRITLMNYFQNEGFIQWQANRDGTVL